MPRAERHDGPLRLERIVVVGQDPTHYTDTMSVRVDNGVADQLCWTLHLHDPFLLQDA